jgi:hypothetical protein
MSQTAPVPPLSASVTTKYAVAWTAARSHLLPQRSELDHHGTPVGTQRGPASLNAAARRLEPT